LLGVASAVAAATRPAWRAADMAIAQLLRSRSTELPSVGGRRAWAIPILTVCVAAASAYLQAATSSAVWGLVASAAIVISAALATRPLLHVLTALAVPWFGATAGPSGRFALATLGLAPRRAALTIATLGVGFATVVWLLMLAHSFEQSVINLLPGILRGDLLVSSTHIGTGYLEAPVDDALTAELRQVPGVAAVAGEQVGEWPIGGGAAVAIDAFDTDYFSGREFGEWPLLGQHLPAVWEGVARGELAVISTN